MQINDRTDPVHLAPERAGRLCVLGFAIGYSQIAELNR
jgi:hypothetical protein